MESAGIDARLVCRCDANAQYRSCTYHVVVVGTRATVGAIRVVATASARLAVGAWTDVASCGEAERGNGNEKSRRETHGC
jgi:hypothetical protein